MSLKKAVRSIQGDFKDKFIGVEYMSKKAKNYWFCTNTNWKKIRQAMIAEKLKAEKKTRLSNG